MSKVILDYIGLALDGKETDNYSPGQEKLIVLAAILYSEGKAGIRRQGDRREMLSHPKNI